jgi:hypothetical protein
VLCGGPALTRLRRITMDKYTYEDKIKCLEAFEKKFEDVLDDVETDGPRSDLWLYNKLWCARYHAFKLDAEDIVYDLTDAMFYLAQKISEEYKEDNHG